MKKIVFALTLAGALSLVGCGKHDKGNDRDMQSPNIDVAEATTDSLTLYNTYPGTVTAASSADVMVEVSGKLLSSHFKSGDYVSKGQPLFTIESTVYRDAVAKAQSALSTAKSQHDYYTRQYAAMQKALEADAVSKMEVLQAKSNMEQAEASIRDAQAALSTAQFNLAKCTVRAPISGVINNASPSDGNYINGEGAPVKISTIYDNSVMNVKVYLSDTQYEELIANNGGISAPVYRDVPIKFREDIGGDYRADFSYVSPSVSSSTGTLLLQGKLGNKDNVLKDGMYVTIQLPYGTDAHAVLVKDASIGTDQLGKYMYTVNDSNKVVYTPIKTGPLYQDSLRVVTSGIKPGQKYVTKALMTVQRGEKINPVLTK
ncbi:MAG: efflux RND transporter periplasmic adaptor subunit [Muribaculaceae bacterium]|nr:efflux RND transporter periplasmic adaptor subunit [Muribaculaceae bacterium]